MKIKKGEVYMYKKSRYWFRIGKYESEFFKETLNEIVNKQIKSGKLIKIPQLYK